MSPTTKSAVDGKEDYDGLSPFYDRRAPGRSLSRLGALACLEPPSASHIVERRSTRIPFLAPTYSVDGVLTMRCVLADSGWVDPKSIHLVATVANTGTVPLAPLVSNIHGCFHARV